MLCQGYRTESRCNVANAQYQLRGDECEMTQGDIQEPVLCAMMQSYEINRDHTQPL